MAFGAWVEECSPSAASRSRSGTSCKSLGVPVWRLRGRFATICAPIRISPRREGGLETDLVDTSWERDASCGSGSASCRLHSLHPLRLAGRQADLLPTWLAASRGRRSGYRHHGRFSRAPCVRQRGDGLPQSDRVGPHHVRRRACAARRCCRIGAYHSTIGHTYRFRRAADRASRIHALDRSACLQHCPDPV